ncbi:MAG: peptidase T [Candidatus Avoscillospira sp.]
MTLTERFLKLVSFDTTSDESSETCPSTPNQKVLGQEIVRQMLEIGITDAHMDENGYVYGTVPATGKGPVIGLIAHMDTSPDASGANIRARVTEPYDGGDVVLNQEKGIVLSPAEFASLRSHVGKHLIVTDGTTLLGADDKAGVAEILACAQRLLQSGKPHGAVRLGFTPDEEIGRGADRFDVAGFAADYAYTVDGGSLGELEYENFNAASATVTFAGKSIHPGSARGKLVNAATLAMEFHNLLPAYEVPACTEGYEGFYHLTGMEGSVEHAQLKYLIRDHDAAKFEARKEFLVNAARFFNEKYGAGTATLTVKDSYRNMKEMILPHMEIVENAKKAMEACGVTPQVIPIRGGTDGARLSFEGLPCPNLCAGGKNCHGRFEYVPVEDMEKIVDILEAIILGAAE